MEEDCDQGGADDSSCPNSEASIGYGKGNEYWDERYLNNPEPFEWLESYFHLRSHIDCVTCGNKDVNILDVGCGNSVLAEDLYDDGYCNVTCVDNSPIVVKQMTARQLQDGIPARPELRWACMDALHMSFPDEHFDLVIDKSLLDTLMCTVGPAGDATSYIQEVFRVLRPGGTLMVVSYGEPETREYLFNLLDRDPAFDFKQYTCELPQHDDSTSTHYLYFGVKLPRHNMQTSS